MMISIMVKIIVLILTWWGIVAAGLTAQPPTIGCDCEYRPAANLIGKTANTVNWGLEIFSSDAASCTAVAFGWPAAVAMLFACRSGDSRAWCSASLA